MEKSYSADIALVAPEVKDGMEFVDAMARQVLGKLLEHRTMAEFAIRPVDEREDLANSAYGVAMDMFKERGLRELELYEWLANMRADMRKELSSG